jgi:hypothetical protein
MTGFQKTTQALTRTVKAYAGAFLLGGGAIYAVKRFVQAAAEQQKAEQQLSAAIGGNIGQLKEYAAEMQRLTIYGDEQIISQMAYAANLGVTQDKLKDVTKAAIGLAAKLRIDLSASMMLMGRASMGQTQMLTRYGIVLDETLTQQEKFDELLRIGAESFKLAEADAATAAGAYAQFKNAVGDLAEAIGEPLLPLLTDLAKSITNLITKVGILEEKFRSAVYAIGVSKETFHDFMGTYWDPGTAEGFTPATPQAQKLADEVAAKRKEVAQAAAEAAAQAQADIQADAEQTTAAVARDYDRLGHSITTSVGGAFSRLVTDAQNWHDHLINLIGSVAGASMAGQMMAQGAMAMFGGAFGATVAHGGGTVGAIGARRNVSPFAFIGAPRLHEGLRANERPAILEVGEEVIPKGGGAQTPAVNFNIYTIDSQGVSRFINENKSEIADAIGVTSRNNHPTGRGPRQWR